MEREPNGSDIEVEYEVCPKKARYNEPVPQEINASLQLVGHKLENKFDVIDQRLAESAEKISKLQEEIQNLEKAQKCKEKEQKKQYKSLKKSVENLEYGEERHYSVIMLLIKIQSKASDKTLKKLQKKFKKQQLAQLLTLNDQLMETNITVDPAQNTLGNETSGIEMGDESVVVIDDESEVEMGDEQGIEMEKIRHVKDEQKIVIEKFKYRIQLMDLKMLYPRSHINDNIINFHMQLITERSRCQDNKLPTVYSFSSFFLNRLMLSGYQGVRRYTAKIDLFSYDIILIPVHVARVHWCMVVINLKEKSIRYYDSMGGSNYRLLHALLDYLEKESLDKRRMPFDTGGFLMQTAKNMPRQQNTFDCGVFACMAAEHVTRCQPLTFTQEDIPDIRTKMLLEISRGTLLQ